MIQKIYALLKELHMLILCLLQLVLPPTQPTTPLGSTHDHPTHPTLSDNIPGIHKTTLSTLAMDRMLLHCQQHKLGHYPCSPAPPWSNPNFPSQHCSFLAQIHMAPHLKHVCFKNPVICCQGTLLWVLDHSRHTSSLTATLFSLNQCGSSLSTIGLER